MDKFSNEQQIFGLDQTLRFDFATSFAELSGTKEDYEISSYDLVDFVQKKLVTPLIFQGKSRLFQR